MDDAKDLIWPIETFDPRQYIIISEKTQAPYLPVGARILWFRSIFPEGKIVSEPIALNENYAIFRTRIFADKNDSEGQFLSQAHAMRYRDASEWGMRYYDVAETMSVGRALRGAGFSLGSSLDEAAPEGVDTVPTISKPVALQVAAPESERAVQDIKKNVITPENGVILGENKGKPDFNSSKTQRQDKPKPARAENCHQADIEKAKAVVIDFGQTHKGKTLGEMVAESENPEANLIWIMNSYKGNNEDLKRAASILYQEMGKKKPA